MEHLPFVLFGVIAGWIAGMILEARKWANNADQIQRIERFGHLYKVHRDDQ